MSLITVQSEHQQMQPYIQTEAKHGETDPMCNCEAFLTSSLSQSHMPLRLSERLLAGIAHKLSPSIRGFATWNDEDMVGKVSRVSRRIGSSRLVALRTMTRELMVYRRLFQERFDMPS